MEKKIIQFEIEGQKIYVEGNLPKESSGKMIASTSGKAIVEATTSFEKTLDPIIAFAGKVISKVKGFSIAKPETIELQFGIKLSGEVNFWVISGTGEGTIDLKFSWKNE